MSCCLWQKPIKLDNFWAHPHAKMWRGQTLIMVGGESIQLDLVNTQNIQRILEMTYKYFTSQMEHWLGILKMLDEFSLQIIQVKLQENDTHWENGDKINK